MPSSRRSSQPRNWTLVSYVSTSPALADGFFTTGISYCKWYEIEVQLYSFFFFFSMGYQAVPTSFVGKTVHYFFRNYLNTFIENWLTANVKVYFWILSFHWSVCLFLCQYLIVLITALGCEFWNWEHESFNSDLLFQGCFDCSGSLAFPYEF